MHILMVSEFFPSLQNQVFSGGVEVRCFYTALYISKNHEVTVLARRKKGELASEVLGKLRIYRFGKEIGQTSATFRSLFSRLAYIILCIYQSLGIKADIIEGSNFVSLIPAFIIGRIKKKPTIAFYPDVLIGKWKQLFGNLLGGIGELVERIIIKLPWDKYIAISNSVKDSLEKYKIESNKIDVIPCGIELPNVIIAEPKQNRLIVISRLVAYKRVDWVIKLLKNIELEFPKLSLLIIGSGPEDEKLKKLANSLKITNKVSFIRDVSKEILYQELNKSLLLVHPSLIEGFGIVLLEANSYGVPFIAANIPTSKELIGKLGGLLFRQDDFSDFVNKTKELISDKSLWQKLSKKGLLGVFDYQWSSIAEKTEKLYLALK